MRRPLLTSLIAAAVIGGPISTASANDFAAGLAVGIIGSAVAADIKRKNQRRSSTKRTSTRRSTVSSSQRAENRAVQTALIGSLGKEALATDEVQVQPGGGGEVLQWMG